MNRISFGQPWLMVVYWKRLIKNSQPFNARRQPLNFLHLTNFCLSTLILSFLFSLSSVNAQSFRLVNYGDDILAIGAGARALGMGSAFSASSNDITAAFWNPASLVQLKDQHQVAYMHSERFGGTVAYDYAAYAQRISNQSKPMAIAISLFRQGVDGIKNTTNAWDVARNLPKPNPEQYFTSFSASDMAALLSVAREESDRLSVGMNAKVLYSRLGPFANGLGYSIDISAFYKINTTRLALQVQNLSGLLKFWQINAEEFSNFVESGDEIPSGENEFIRPSIRFGASQQLYSNNELWKALINFDTHIRFENRQTYYLNAGPISFEPHLGAEIGYRSLLFARFGLTDLATNWNNTISISPTIGAGIHVGKLQVDYAFASFAGATVDLGYTHRISLIAGW